MRTGQAQRLPRDLRSAPSSSKVLAAGANRGGLGERWATIPTLGRKQQASYSMQPRELVQLFAEEILRAHRFAATLDPGITVFGSARTPERDPGFIEAKQWGEALLLSNVYAQDPSIAVRAVLAGTFSSEATGAVSAAVLGAAAGVHGPREVSMMLAGMGGASSPAALEAARTLLAAKDIDPRAIEALKSVIRSGAGPGIMDAVLAGYSDARDRLVALFPDLPEAILSRLELEGSRIKLSMEQQTSPYFVSAPGRPGGPLKSALAFFNHFDARREALLLRATGLVALTGGIGTLNEIFVALRKGLPVVFDQGYYGELMGTILERWQARGFSADAADKVILKRGLSEGLPAVIDRATKEPSLIEASPAQAQHMASELVRGMLHLVERPAAVSIVGDRKLSRDDPATRATVELARALAGAKVPIKLGSGGALFDGVARAVKQRDRSAELQAVLMGGDAQPQQLLKSDAFEVVHSPNVQKVLLTENSDAYVFAPGGVDVFDALFEVLVLIQTEKIAKKPVVLIDQQFWAPILDQINERMAKTAPATIGDHDIGLLTVLKIDGPITEKDRGRAYQVVDQAGAVEQILRHRAEREASG